MKPSALWEAACRRCSGPDDVIGRIGGDEWMVFLNSTNSRELAGKKAELLMQHLKLGMSRGYRHYP